MMKARTLRRMKAAAMTACTVTAGTVFASACSVQDIYSNVISGSLGAVKAYAQGFWTTLIPTLGDAITIAQNAGLPIPNPPWP